MMRRVLALLGCVAVTAGLDTLEILGTLRPNYGSREVFIHRGTGTGYASAKDTLIVFDASNANMSIYSTVSLPASGTGDIVVDEAGETAYLASWDQLMVMDVKDPWNVQLKAGPLPLNGSQYEAVELYQNKLFVGGEEFFIFDVSDPSSPVLASSLKFRARNLRVDVIRDLLYVCTSDQMLVYDLSSLSQVGKVGLPSMCHDVAPRHRGNIIYAATRSGIVTIDIKDPSAPQITDTSESKAYLGIAVDPATELVYSTIIGSSPYSLQAADPTSGVMVPVASAVGPSTRLGREGLVIFGDYVFFCDFRGVHVVNRLLFVPTGAPPTTAPTSAPLTPAPSTEAPVTASPGCGAYPEVLIGGRSVPAIPVEGESDVDGGALSLHSIPSSFTGGAAVYIPGTLPVPADADIELSCCGAQEACDFIVSVYHCPPCSTGKNGGFPSLLPTRGFEAASCAPVFGRGRHRMTSFRVSVPASSSVVLPSDSQVSYMAVFGKHGAFKDWCPAVSTKFGGPQLPLSCVCNTD